MSIALNALIKALVAKVEQQGKELEDLRTRIEKIEQQRKPGRPPKNG